MAGVSVSTVSLVHSKRGYVSAKTRVKVEKVIAKHNYHPKQSARNLASGRTGNIGFILSDIHLSSTEMFYSRVLLGAELEARKRDYYILLTTADEGFQPPKDAPRFLKSGDVDAVIIAGSVPNELIEYVQELKLPYVLVDYRHPAIKSNLVLIENFDGAHVAVNHLLDNGHKQIAFVGGSFNHSSIQERFRGYQAALLSSGLDEVANNKSIHYLVQQEITTQIGFDGICELLDNNVKIDAVVCANDTTAIGCLQALKQRQISIPQDIAVVGFDDIAYARDTDPSLTTVHVPKLEMGIQAVRLIFDLLDHPLSGLQSRIINTELVVRESTNGIKQD
ncbi:MAG: LacI family DNA-binding transcriptional regulator [Candidatus Marinimicrobia bacterium]|nr:LacI family DNA-binding transcriptional regulator [Candidatus Neomarinimicrobiota bacterium]